jgi:ABC-type transport system involved in cytochrome c biogenesis permease subunit
MQASLIAALVVGLAAAVQGVATERGDFDWTAWRHLVVRDKGRCKPLDTLARETWQDLTLSARCSEPKTGAPMDCTQAYVSMLMEWSGWDRSPDKKGPPSRVWKGAYFQLHKPDRWDDTALLPIKSSLLHGLLGLRRDQTHVSSRELSTAKITVSATKEEEPFLNWAEGLERREGEDRSELQRRALELANSLWEYHSHRMGQRLLLVPAPDGPDKPWLSLAALISAEYTDANDPGGRLRKVQQLLTSCRRAFLTNSAAGFNSESAKLAAQLKECRQLWSRDASSFAASLEVAFNRWHLFRIAGVCLALAFAATVSSVRLRRPTLVAVGTVLYCGGSIAALIGFLMRSAITGRLPAANSYEFMICFGVGAALLGWVLERIDRGRLVISAAAAIAACAFLSPEVVPNSLDERIATVAPILNSGFWLSWHVAAIALSFAAFALSAAAGNIALGFFLASVQRPAGLSRLTALNERIMELGLLLLGIGVIAGCAWADNSWGRFWNWDPKEIWTLMAVAGYASLLYARRAGLVGHFGVAALSAACFALVAAAWYGVNFLLRCGLHTYGFGEGGAACVVAVLVLQALFVAWVAFRSGGKLARGTEPQILAIPERRVTPTSPFSAKGRPSNVTHDEKRRSFAKTPVAR